MTERPILFNSVMMRIMLGLSKHAHPAVDSLWTQAVEFRRPNP